MWNCIIETFNTCSNINIVNIDFGSIYNTVSSYVFGGGTTIEQDQIALDNFIRYMENRPEVSTQRRYSMGSDWS